MVRTRSGDALTDHIKAAMPVKDANDVKDEIAEEDEVTASSQQHESSEDKDISYRPDCYRELRNRFVLGRRSKRDSRKGMSSRSLRKRYVEEDLEESHDAMMTDEDSDDIFPRRGKRASRHHMSSRHMDRRLSHGHSHSLRLRHKQKMADDAGDKEAQGDGVRRSTRTRKQKYDSYNNSWIDGMNGHASLRGYPSMFPCARPGTLKAEPGGAGQQGADPQADPHTADTTTGYVYVSDNKEDDKEEEEEEEESRPMKRGRTIAELDTSRGDLQNGDDLDMYSRVKRLRRPAKRFMFEDDNVPSTAGRIEDNQTETQSSQTSTDEGSEGEKVPKYSLRKTKPMVDRFQATIDPPRQGRSVRVMHSMLRRRGTRRPRSPSTSSSDEERFDRPRGKSAHSKTLTRCLPTPMNLEASGLQSRPGDAKASNLADVDPMALDRSIMFQDVGGLEEHIRCLKEMVVFPMLYPEVFERFHIQPAKGVLFHGLPGTGKTLLARALANECSQGQRKVAFFMRKGADCLTKWVGESERQLRLLFDQAYQMRPSIIFFDEMDGLAPVRSTKQDQIHASIVSTLLALMDGLDSRGEVIVVGATNRIDAIDPALRRPGRFDRELYFPLPARQERQEILRIHMGKWTAPPTPPLLSTLAEGAAGYCGSDLRALCSEAVLQGLRRRYPQIYATNQKLLLDPMQVKVEMQDFLRARATIVPAAHRCTPSAARKLPPAVQPLLADSLQAAVATLARAFPHGTPRSLPSSQLLNLEHAVHRPHLLVTASNRGFGQNLLGPALLSHMEHVAVHVLDLSALCQTSCLSAEEACIQVFNEARRNLPSIVYVPSIGRLWSLTSETLHAVFLSRLSDLDPGSPILLLATADSQYQDLPPELSEIFSQYRGEVLPLSAPSAPSREAFFRPLFLDAAPLPPPAGRLSDAAAASEVLPLAPPPAAPQLSEEQLKLRYEQEEQTLRELRIFLRDCCSKLARNRLFFMFTKPVDIEEVPDYLNIVKQPMDLETMMTKIDLHRYACAQEFLDDIDLIVRNALEYNPDRTGEDKLIRHRACCLRDTAYALIKAEMDTDYEDKCRKISASRQQRADSPSRFVPEFIRTKPVAGGGPAAPGADQAAGAARGSTDASSAPAAATPPPPHPAKKASGVAKDLLKRAWDTQSKVKRRSSLWSRGMLGKKVVKKVRPIIAAPASTPVPVSHAPHIPDRGDSDSDNRPLVNGNASGHDRSPTDDGRTDERIKSPVVVNGVDLDRSDGSLEIQPNAWKEKSVHSDATTPDHAKDNTKQSPPEDKARPARRGSKSPFRNSVSPGVGSRLSSRLSSRKASDAAPAAVALAAAPAIATPDAAVPGDGVVAADASNEGRTVVVCVDALKGLLRRTVDATAGCNVDTLLDLHAQLGGHVHRFSKDWERSALIDCLADELDRFEDFQSSTLDT